MKLVLFMELIDYWMENYPWMVGEVHGLLGIK